MDLLDYYRGSPDLSMRRLCLLVVGDIARMPRTRAAEGGLDPHRPWGELNDQLALLDMRLQATQTLLWVGLRLKGKPPQPSPYPRPEPASAASARGGAAAGGGRRAAPQLPQRIRSYLDRFSPGAAPAA